MKMYRGLDAVHWANLLFKKGWPPYAAGQMAVFLTGMQKEPPTWDELTEQSRKNRRED